MRGLRIISTACTHDLKKIEAIERIVFQSFNARSRSGRGTGDSVEPHLAGVQSAVLRSGLCAIFVNRLPTVERI